VERVGPKLYNWASILEGNTRGQAMIASEMPFVWPHAAIMPDAHLGKGACVGLVYPTLGAIVPATVGVDIGCGMVAHRTSLHAEELESTEKRQLFREMIERAIPLSAGNYNHKLWSRATERRVNELEAMPGAAEASMVSDWSMQLGSLGSGNHFIEVSVDEEGMVWLFLHSGSRGVGNKIAQKHIEAAKTFCDKYWIQLPDPDLAYLVEGTPEFDAYLRDLQWAQHFALLNREEMVYRVAECLSHVMGRQWYVTERVNCHHNYTEVMPGPLIGRFKYPKGKHGHIWLSRKGAIDATEGKPGLIPGSMGAASYVVTGRGDPMSLYSSPHGAGRAYSRGEARRTFTMEDLEARMTAQNIEWRHTDAFLDEHPSAYKDIDIVMADARSLVEVQHTLHQIINVKGD
jgi:tRNA-splicing ligase RtcB